MALACQKCRNSFYHRLVICPEHDLRYRRCHMGKKCRLSSHGLVRYQYVVSLLGVSFLGLIICLATKLIVGANFALPAACLCICIHLEQVASVRRARGSIDDKRRRQFFEAFMCIGLPLVFMAFRMLVH